MPAGHIPGSGEEYKGQDGSCGLPDGGVGLWVLRGGLRLSCRVRGRCRTGPRRTPQAGGSVRTVRGTARPGLGQRPGAVGTSRTAGRAGAGCRCQLRSSGQDTSLPYRLRYGASWTRHPPTSDMIMMMNPSASRGCPVPAGRPRAPSTVKWRAGRSARYMDSAGPRGGRADALRSAGWPARCGG